MRSLRFAVEPMQLLLFSRAVGARSADVAGWAQIPPAPPTFTESLQQVIPEYGWRPVIGQRWVGSGLDAPAHPTLKADQTTVLHAEQHFEYFLPLRAGDQLTATTTDGDSWTKRNRRGELLEFREIVTEFHSETGELVVRSRAVEVRTRIEPAAPA